MERVNFMEVLSSLCKFSTPALTHGRMLFIHFSRTENCKKREKNQLCLSIQAQVWIHCFSTSSGIHFSWWHSLIGCNFSLNWSDEVNVFFCSVRDSWTMALSAKYVHITSFTCAMLNFTMYYSLLVLFTKIAKLDGSMVISSVFSCSVKGCYTHY